ncbi:MAG: thiol protease/hemagglutinin PrtT [Bacteroidales bacterium]|nr:thiol protease/hemagglutinin PrtT [Bacteroidales bacterium]
MKPNHIILLFVLSLFITKFAEAKPITKEQAYKIAYNKLTYLEKSNFNIENIENCKSKGKILFYIVNLKPHGFIIVSGDTELHPVYSYSFTNNFKFSDTEINPLNNFLEKNMSFHFENISEKSNKVNQDILSEWEYYLSEDFNSNRNKSFIQWPPAGTTSTGGWLETNWHQNAPYNQFCPLDLDDGGRSVTGCPSTALAMIIDYYQTVNGTTFTDADDYYHNYSGNQFTIDDDYVEYDFLNFPEINTFLSSISAKYAAQEVITDEEAAALTFACGVAATQVYSAAGSGTFGVNQAFNAYQKFSFTDAELMDETNPDVYTILSENMIDGRPAHLAVTDPPPITMGHNVVVDGYNTDNFFHLNFGWGGPYNNWYLIPEGIPYGLTELEGVILNIDNPQINDEAEFYHFSFDEQTSPATIETDNISIEVAYETDLTNLIPTFQISRGASAEIDGSEIISDETVIDFSSSPVTILVIAENGIDTKEWTVNVTEALPNTETEIITFEFGEQTSPATINTGTIDIEVETGTDLSSLIPVFTLSYGATAEVDEVEVISGVSEIDFSEGFKIFVITAENEITTQNWTVSVYLETGISNISDNIKLFPNPCKDIINIYSENLKLTEIFSSAGRLIESIDMFNNQISINLKNKCYSSGLYFFKFSDNEGNYLYKKVILK